MAIEARVEGLSDLVARLRALPAEMASKNGGSVRRALFKAAKVIKDEAVANVKRETVDTGALRDSISTFRDKNPRAQGATEVFRVGIRKVTRAKQRKAKTAGVEIANPRRYAHLLEFGTAKAKAEPFLRPAFESKKAEALAVFSEDLAKGVKAAEAKLSRQRAGGFT